MSVFEELDRQRPGWDRTRAQERAEASAAGRPVCVCGHLNNSHPVGIGGALTPFSGVAITGCIGPMSGRGSKARNWAREGDVVVRRATCPCQEWRPVCEFVRPQYAILRTKMGARHPLMVALSGFRTQIRNTKSVTDVEAELTSRFRWIESARVCSVCGTGGEGVWPVYVDADRNSEMRCEEHTP